MKTATLTDVRQNFSRVASWLDTGETVQILRRGHAYARITPEPNGFSRTVPNPDALPAPKVSAFPDVAPKFEMSDWLAWRKRILGDRHDIILKELAEMDAYEQEGQC
jgi:antitoxin (DNA-binding transcriptional repressor) of toxin-antitoxin stability system